MDRRHRLLIVLIIALVALWQITTRTAPEQPAPPSLDRVLEDLDAQITADFAKDGIGGLSVAIVAGPRIVWSRHYGYADAEAGRRPTNDSAYRIGSITKQFTALALLQLVEQGRMRLSDPLEKYVPEIKQVQKTFAGTPPITLLQVATMHSGLAREPGPACKEHSIGPVSVWQQKVLACLPTVEYQYEPGTQYLYSNIGYASLGLAIERAAAKPFTAVVTDGILKPLNMSRTAFEPTVVVRKDLAHGYQRRGGKGVPDQRLDGRGYRVPNGALFSTVNDLAKFVSWEVGDGPDGILKRTTQDANYGRVFFSNPALTSGYGVGFMVSRRGDVLMIGHGGSTEGYHASALVNRELRVGVVALRNCDNCPVDAGPVASRILERMVTASRALAR
jgi:D-alanyl-D-alanine carboxypeptidase